MLYIFYIPKDLSESKFLDSSFQCLLASFGLGLYALISAYIFSLCFLHISACLSL